MQTQVAVHTIIPMLLLTGAGVLARRFEILSAGDDRVLNAYLYYFALPALFIADLSETSFDGPHLTYILANMLPALLALGIFGILYFLLHFSRAVLVLLIVSTSLGSFNLFGIPFVIFAFSSQETENIAALTAAAASAVGVSMTLAALELYRLNTDTIRTGARKILSNLLRNPLILSIAGGCLLSIMGVQIPQPLSRPLHMMGVTTAPVALFMLGAFLYGRRYKNIASASALTVLRMLFMPLIALMLARAFNVSGPDLTIMVLMHSMPVAVTLIVLSERYNFYRETIASLVLISSVSAVLYLPVWYLILQQK
ncbi:MAG: AEC family transporter [Nitrospirae bacterium]|nr:AEC family transporter [Nitrospirota bacterium]NTW66459.1 AEC family transporter [Nitrospirota bacterium]